MHPASLVRLMQKRWIYLKSGDKKYADADSLALSEKLQVRNVALCAVTLTFNHPATKEKLEYTVNPANPAFALF